MRIETAKIFMDRMEGVDYLTPQISKYDAKNSFWALAVKYDGHDKRGLSWEDFRKRYIELEVTDLWRSVSAIFRACYFQ